MEEVTGPVIAIVLVLFRLHPDCLSRRTYRRTLQAVRDHHCDIGRHFRFVALTLTPAMCAKILKPKVSGKGFFLFRWFNSFFDSITGATPPEEIFLKGPLSLSSYSSFCRSDRKDVYDRTFISGARRGPGIIMSSMSLPDGASLNMTQKLTDKVMKIAQGMDQVQTALVFSGYSLLALRTSPTTARPS